MALREIRLEGDEILKKVSKPVKEINDRVKELISDMKDTMKEANGAGIAAVQVGVLKRVFIVDVGDERGQVVFINPEMISEEGEQIGIEGCLSVPDNNGIVKRANNVKVKYTDEDGKECELEADGFFARAVQHEYDHLNGKLYTEIAEVMNPKEEDYPEYFEKAEEEDGAEMKSEEQDSRK